MPHHNSPPIQSPLLPHQPELFGYDRFQPNSWDAHFNNLPQTGLFDPTTSFPTSTSIVPHPTSASNVPHVPQSPAQNLGHSHLPFLNDQPLLDPIPPMAPPAMLDGFGQHRSTNQTFQVWPTYTCALCSVHPTFLPVRFDDGWSAFAGRDVMTPPTASPFRSSSRANPAASLHTTPSIRPAQPQFPGVVNAGSDSWDLTAADGGSARPSSRPGRVPSVRSARGRRARTPPLVRVEDRIEWVRDDLMKMTLLFNWSPQAEAEVHEPWD